MSRIHEVHRGQRHLAVGDGRFASVHRRHGTSTSPPARTAYSTRRLRTLACSVRTFPFSTALNVDRISEEGTQGLLRQGQSLVSYEDSIIAQHLSRAATRRLRKFDVIAAVVNATVLSSEIGNAMMQEGVMKEDVGLALICSYSVTHNNWRISARSMFPRRGVDVSEIAQAYGGGGHRAAAGFCVRPSFVVLPNRHMYNQVQVADLESLFIAE